MWGRIECSCGQKWVQMWAEMGAGLPQMWGGAEMCAVVGRSGCRIASDVGGRDVWQLWAVVGAEVPQVWGRVECSCGQTWGHKRVHCGAELGAVVGRGGCRNAPDVGPN